MRFIAASKDVFVAQLMYSVSCAVDHIALRYARKHKFISTLTRTLEYRGNSHPQVRK
jgi:hypothetical protein